MSGNGEPLPIDPQETGAIPEAQEGFHEGQIGPFATKEKLDEQIESEFGSLLNLMTARGLDTERLEKVREIKDEIFGAYDKNHFELQENPEKKPLDEEEKKVVTLTDFKATAHQADNHIKLVLLGQISACKGIVETTLTEDGQIASGEEIRAALEKKASPLPDQDEKASAARKQALDNLANNLSQAKDSQEVGSTVTNSLTAAVLHDIGYVNRKNETVPNGGCLAPLHEDRSLEFAQIYLDHKGWQEKDITQVNDLIDGTKMNTNYEERYPNQALTQETARLLHLSDLAAFACTHDQNSLTGNEAIPTNTSRMYHEFSFPQVALADPDNPPRFLTVQGTPETDEKYQWAAPKNVIFGSLPFHFVTSDWLPSLRNPLDELFLLSDQKDETNPYREGLDITIKRQKALKRMIEPGREYADISYLEGNVHQFTWLQTLQETEVEVVSETGQTEKRKILGANGEVEKERLKIRMKESGTESEETEPSLNQLIDRLPTQIIKDKLVEIAEQAPNDRAGQENQKALLENLFKNVALSLFREGITHAEIRFAINAYSEETRERLREKGLEKRALNYGQIVFAAGFGTTAAEAQMAKADLEQGAAGEKAPKKKTALIATIRMNKDIRPDRFESFRELRGFLPQEKTSGLIEGVSLAGTQSSLLDTEQREKIITAARLAKAYGAPLELIIGEQSLIDQAEIKAYQEAIKEITPLVDRFATGVAANQLGLSQLGKPLVFAPLNNELMGEEREATFGVVQEISRQPNHPPILLASANAKITLASWPEQTALLYERVTGKRIEESPREEIRNFLHQLTPPDKMGQALFGKTS
jgi:hypothetical protein